MFEDTKELLSNKGMTEEERKIFVKEMAEKKAAERIEVVKQARMLLLHKKSLCRQINRAFLASERFKELDTQLALQKIIKTIEKQQDAEYVDYIKADVARDEKQKKEEADERARTTKNYRMDLKRQIEKNEHDNKLKAIEEMKSEKQNLSNMNQKLQLIKEKELQEISNRKKNLHKFFKDAVEEEERVKLKLKRDEEIQNRALEIFQKTKDRIQEIHKSITMKGVKEKERQKNIIVEHYGAIVQASEEKKSNVLQQNMKEKGRIESEKQKAKQEREKVICAHKEVYNLQHQASEKQTKRQKEEEKELRNWEMIQRFRRAEFDKQNNWEENKRRWQQKLEYRNELQKDIEEKQIEKNREKEMAKVEDISTKTALEKANRRILLYGDEILKESKDIRPLYPIVKGIQECKTEMGLTLTEKAEENFKMGRSRRGHGISRAFCT